MLFKNNKKELESLRKHRDRLKVVLNDLLSLADDTDQSSKYGSHDPDPVWSRRLKTVCAELLEMSEELAEIDRLISSKKIGEARNLVLGACHKAEEIAANLQDIRRS